MITLAMAFSLFLQDQVDNPEFKGWSSCKPGSSVTHKMAGGTGPQGGEQKTVLKSVNDTEIVLEVETIINGKSLGKTMERKVSAKIPADKAPKDVKKGEDEIEVAGKKMKCATMEFETTTANGKTFHMKIWANDEIPGRSAKMEVSSENFKNTMTASSWEKK